MKETLGKRIMRHRKALGLTQDQLAEQLGVTAQAVSKWENDLSCPDIAMLPKLSGVFHITTDQLLGQVPEEAPTFTGEVVDSEPEGIHLENNGFEFHWDGGRKSGLSFAVLVLAVGLQLLLARLYSADISFWQILWPSALAVWGLGRLLSRFSFIRLGTALAGLWFLLDHWKLIPIELDKGLLFPILVLLFGAALLVDAITKPRKKLFSIHGKDKQRRNDFSMEDESFGYNASFGSSTQLIQMPRLTEGDINCAFGDYTVDFSGVEELSGDCQVAVNCSFGNLLLLVPRHFAVQQTNSTSFGNFEISGQPVVDPKGVLCLSANCSFGQIQLRYI